MSEKNSKPETPLSRRDEIGLELQRLSEYQTTNLVWEAGELDDVEREKDLLEQELASLDWADV